MNFSPDSVAAIGISFFTFVYLAHRIYAIERKAKNTNEVVSAVGKIVDKNTKAIEAFQNKFVEYLDKLDKENKKLRVKINRS